MSDSITAATTALCVHSLLVSWVMICGCRSDIFGCHQFGGSDPTQAAAAVMRTAWRPAGQPSSGKKPSRLSSTAHASPAGSADTTAKPGDLTQDGLGTAVGRHQRCLLLRMRGVQGVCSSRRTMRTAAVLQSSLTHPLSSMAAMVTTAAAAPAAAPAAALGAPVMRHRLFKGGGTRVQATLHTLVMLRGL